MSEHKKWVGYADLLEAKRKRDEREELAIAAKNNSKLPQADLAYIVEKEPDTSPTGAATPVTTPVITPATTTVTTPAATPAPVLASISKTEHASLAERPLGEDLPNQPLYLDATHTASEQRVYSVMYRETVSKGLRERHFGPSELCRKTGIRSDRTIRTALHGLAQKLSIDIVSNVNGNPLGPRYKVYDPKEINKRRRAVGMEIDSQSKKIVNRTQSTTPVATPVTTPVATPATTGDKNYRSTPAGTTPVTPVSSTGVIKYRNSKRQSEVDTASSSSKSSANTADDDKGFLDSLREIYEETTGNSWTTSDVITAQRGQDISLEVWGIAICYCVDRAPGHKFDRLAYVLEEARRHQEEMSEFSREDMRLIMRHAMRQINRARASGKWEPNAGREEGNEPDSSP